eukprot:g4446.t1
MASAVAAPTPAKTDEPVIFTGTDAAVSKLSAASRGYTADAFISSFVDPKRRHLRRAPLINRGYFARTAAVDTLVLNFLSAGGDGAAKQIVTLGAGNDTLFFRLRDQHTALSECVTVFETDFPAVIARKRHLIASHPVMKSLADELRYKTFGSDLRDLDAVSQGLSSCGFNANLPTLFLSECVLIYLDVGHSDALIQWAASSVKGGGVFITYEQILPNDPFGAMMVRNIASRGCPLRSIDKYPSLSSLKSRYESLGWPDTVVRDMNDVYYNFLRKDEVKRIERLEIFDELEEWHLIQAHYSITVAVKPSELVSSASLAFCVDRENT